MIPNEETFKQWLADPVTQFVLKDYMGTLIEGVKDEWANGGYTRETESGTLQLNASALSHVKTLMQLRELSYEDLITQMQDEPRRTADEPQ